MSITAFENAAHDLGISLASLKVLAPGGPSAGTPQLPAATATTVGGVKQAAAVADSAAADVAALVAEFNALLAALRAAGVMAAVAALEEEALPPPAPIEEDPDAEALPDA